ncbi:uncharacterized protein LOC131660387 [Vicia villosa]|uniref:uncharacterized protein LOC131660387 n=1 Tax=Vicia villosa TaxID=3911 RepID=UPI00273AB897|nr:uncharacterized protein LOC131660387 [Vicia villosa]XP_058785612.1 uncharacterized protein LOC131660387 [Vicia villosa]XP_058785613.1 uncharacterized protein LOC131660387 [Vicia villosa]XP_058785614.1 uncharacterized protein LOC131660387 [Vicia villosa]XP_058785615.1 uncharacterized protein LOC131660387 [Vicia villosa]
MAVSPMNTKSNFHGRSISLPSRPHPLILKCNQHLETLQRSSDETSSSSSVFHKIDGLRDLIECVENLIQLPLTQDALLHDQHQENWVNNLLDGSLRLLDVCSSAKDAVIHTKECTRELQSIIRRRGGGTEVTAEAKKFLTSRKVVKKAISKVLTNLKANTKNCNVLSTKKDHQTEALIKLLQDVEVVTLSTFQTILQYISGTTQSKSNIFGSISKLIQPKRVACSLLTDESEFAQVDVALQCFLFTKTRKLEGINDLQNHLEKTESCIQDLEEGLEFLFRRLIKIRVSLLNILNN